MSNQMRVPVPVKMNSARCGIASSSETKNGSYLFTPPMSYPFECEGNTTETTAEKSTANANANIFCIYRIYFERNECLWFTSIFTSIFTSLFQFIHTEELQFCSVVCAKPRNRKIKSIFVISQNLFSFAISSIAPKQCVHHVKILTMRAAQRLHEMRAFVTDIFNCTNSKIIIK